MSCSFRGAFTARVLTDFLRLSQEIHRVGEGPYTQELEQYMLDPSQL